jgi:hypothetical protein
MLFCFAYLLDEPQLLPLALVDAHVDVEVLLQPVWFVCFGAGGVDDFVCVEVGQALLLGFYLSPHLCIPSLTHAPLEGEDEEFGVVLVVEGREGDGAVVPRLEPVHREGVDGHRLLRRDVRPVLQVVVLPLLLEDEK